jgi:hypothetical protein
VLVPGLEALQLVLYADDLFVFATTQEELEAKLQQLWHR